ncbi:PilZ domain-containing protein [Parasphingopyxis marina]|uniref:PilZ domain-containing protein n=1 Tax=Parasphingopyxis marina TaxID=2761622 RepID=A0A842I0Y9_9SPHN|nr:PilZ domain-containing protein [Parasphingopyxis marina]MBC2777840.1 PilZ domain-containing protein [Parasphingopyxis marina]
MRLSTEYCDEGLGTGSVAAGSIDIWARVSQYERKPKLATVRDLSPSGFMLDRNSSVEVGTLLLLQFPGLNSMVARVIWINDILVGCEFERPLSSEEMATLQKSAWCM